MALARVKNWVDDETLFASDLNAEFNNILTGALNLISPLTGTLDANNQTISQFVVDAYTTAGLPSVPSAGRIARVTDGIRGLWTSAESDWTPVSPFINVAQFPGADLGAQFTAAVAALPATGGTLWIPPGSYATTTELAITGGTPVSVWAYGVTVTTSGAIAGLAIGGGANRTAVYGLEIDHAGNADAPYGLSIEQAAHTTLRDIRVYAGDAAGYAGIRVGQSDGADPDTGAFWTTIEHAVIRDKAGGSAGMYPTGILLEGSGGNATAIRGGQISNATDAIRIAPPSGQANLSSGLTIWGPDLEVCTNGVIVSGTNASVVAGPAIFGLRAETITTLYTFTFSGGAPNVARPPTITGSDLASSVTTYLSNPQAIDVLIWDFSITPASDLPWLHRGLRIQPQGAAEDALDVLSPGGGRGIRVRSGGAGSTSAVLLAWTGSGTKGRVTSGANDNLAVSSVQGLSATTTDANNLRGQLTIADANTTGTVTFGTAEPDATYHVVLTPTAKSGAPAAASNRVESVSKLAASFTVTLEAAPGAGTSRTFDWVLVR